MNSIRGKSIKDPEHDQEGLYVEAQTTDENFICGLEPHDPPRSNPVPNPVTASVSSLQEVDQFARINSPNISPAFNYSMLINFCTQPPP